MRVPKKRPSKTPPDSAADRARSAFMSRLNVILASQDGAVPTELLRAIGDIEAKAKIETARRKVITAADEFEALLNKNPSEEAIHSYIAERPFIFGHRNRYHVNEDLAEGVLSKFPITPDRIPDFISVSYYLHGHQMPNQICIWELKRTNARLFSTHARLSKELNDAWMESVDSLRLIGLNYPDFVRRAVKRVLDHKEGTASTELLPVVSLDDHSRPRCHARILIGRRSSLSSEDMARVRELAFSTNFSIQIATYDSILDDLRQKEHGEMNRWPW